MNEDEEEHLNGKLPKLGKLVGNKKRKLLEEYAVESVEDSDDMSSFGNGWGENSCGYRPLLVQSEWIEPHTMTKRLPLAILLRSGIEAGGFCSRVLYDGEYIELAIRSPCPLMNPELLHKKWLISIEDGERIELYHPNIIEFQNTLKLLRKTASDSMESKMRTRLPFAVQTHIEKKQLFSWRDSTFRIIYLGLKSVMQWWRILTSLK